MAGTVSVGCRLPNGIWIHNDEMEEVIELGLHGVERKVMRARLGAMVKLNGWAKFATKEAPHEIVHRSGITHGIDADFWAKWSVSEQGRDLIKKNIVYAQTKAAEIIAQARDHRTVDSGLDPVDPKALPAEFKGKVETADHPAA